MKCLGNVAALVVLAAFVSAASAADPPAAPAVPQETASAPSPTAVTPPAGNPNQLRCLAETPAKPRFAITDRLWPAKPGEASVCLWAGDKLAAASITIDDNWGPDHPWWIEQGQKTGFKFTWFVITERPDTSGPWGTWEGFRKLYELGHDVQSHSVSHLHGTYDIDAEYRESKAALEKNIPGNKVLVMARPGGQHDVKNDTAIAAKYYVAGRGTRGDPNRANLIDYQQTHSTGLTREMIDKTLNKGDRNYWRGWLCTHFHGISNGKTEEEKQQKAQRVAEAIAYLKSKEADIWVGTFREVVLYGQERDTATLTVTENTEQSIKLTLTDTMDDTLFDYPLTIKVRLPSTWTAATATQGDKATAVRIAEQDGGRFALVKAVPDRGMVTLTPAAAQGSSSGGTSGR
jgi:oligosaccharide reducing-end xylanase